MGLQVCHKLLNQLVHFVFDRSQDLFSDACKVPLDVLEMYLRFVGSRAIFV